MIGLMTLLRQSASRPPTPAAPAAPAVSSVPPAAALPVVAASVEAADEAVPGTVERLLRLVAGVVAPTTVLSALLYYFGYVTTLAQYAYFGVDVDMAGLTTADYLLRSAAAVYVPFGAVFLVSLVAVWAHLAVRRVLDAGHRARAVRAGTTAVAALGLLLVGRGVLGVVVPGVSRAEAPGVSPLSLAAGVVLLAYARWLSRRAATRDGRTTATSPWVELVSAGLVAGLVVLSLFWAANSFAAAYGRGRAISLAERLHTRPAVVIDTTERLYLALPGVQETVLPTDTDQVFRYRYRGLRLLLQSRTGMFLVPDTWQPADGTTLVVPNEGVRLQLSRG